jgi:hypothetical protein
VIGPGDEDRIVAASPLFDGPADSIAVQRFLTSTVITCSLLTRGSIQQDSPVVLR